MTFADDVASHISTNFTAGTKSAGMIFDNIEDKTSAQWGQTGGLDVVMVIDQTATINEAGWGHVNAFEAATIKIWARIKGASANVKDRLKVIMDEVEHTLHWFNHKISGYTFHHCSSRFDGSDKDAISHSGHPEAYGVLTVVARKNGRTA